MSDNPDKKPIVTELNHSYTPEIVAWIRKAATLGRYDIRGMGAKRKLPSFDDLSFLTASMSRYPLEGYREKCNTETVLGTRYAKKPIKLDIPITVAGMRFRCLKRSSQGRSGTRGQYDGHLHHHG